MSEWTPQYIQTTVEPVTVLQSNEDVKMKRFNPIVAYTPVGAIPMVSEIPKGNYVEHSDVQKMLDEILICTFKIDHPEIKEIMTREGFEVES